MKTGLTELLGIKYPVIQGAMAWVANAQLAAAVSNGGGLGVIAAGATPPEVLEKDLASMAQRTDKPWALNIMLLSPTADDALELAAKYRVPVVTTGAGSPGKVIERLKPLGTKVIPVVPTGVLARRVEKQGADAVIAEGMEAGGHIGELTTMVLTPMVVRSVEKIPVVLAGGAVDGAGLAAALMLGAAGVQMGTRFLCCDECWIHENYKQAVLKAKERCTAVTGASTGHPVRALSNKLTKEFERLEAAGASLEEIEKVGVGKLRSAVVDGDTEMGSLMAGQSAALVHDIRPAADLLREMVDDAKKRLTGFCGGMD